MRWSRRVVVQVQRLGHDEERRDADRDVDEEDPAPAVDAEDLSAPAKNPPMTGPSTLEVPKTARK
jgi:hypothetical protein